MINNKHDLYKDDLQSNTYHPTSEKLAMFLFVISLGLGEIINIGPIKFSYFTTSLYAFLVLFHSNWNLQIAFENPKYNSILKFCCVWIGYAVFQALWIKSAFYYLCFLRILIINIVVIYFILTYIRTLDDWIFVLRSFIVLVVISLFVGHWEIITGDHIVFLEGESNLLYYKHVPLAFYGNGNDYATVLVLGIFALILNISNSKKDFIYILLSLIIILDSVYQIVIINCRGALYSIFLIAVLLFVFYIVNKVSTAYNRQIINMTLVIIVISVFIFIFSKYSPSELVTKYSEAGNYRSDIGRLKIIRNGLLALINSLGFGLGAGQSILVNNINLHFFYLEILVDYGIYVGGYLIVQFFSLAFVRNLEISDLNNAVVRTFPVTLILLGVSSSGMIRLRATWVLFSLIYILAYNEFKDTRRL